MDSLSETSQSRPFLLLVLKSSVFLKKVAKKFCSLMKKRYICSVFKRIGDNNGNSNQNNSSSYW